MAATFSGRVVLLCLAGVARVNWDICFLDIVFGLLPLAASGIVLVCDCVLRASVLLLNGGIVWACRLLRALFLLTFDCWVESRVVLSSLSYPPSELL